MTGIACHNRSVDLGANIVTAMDGEPRSCVICRSPIPPSKGRRPRGETCGTARCRQAKSRRDARTREAYDASPEGQAERAQAAARERALWDRVRAEEDARKASERVRAETDIWAGYSRGDHEHHYSDGGCARTWMPEPGAALVGDLWHLLGSGSQDGTLPTITALSENLGYLARADVRTLMEIGDDGDALLAALQAILPAVKAEIRKRPKAERDEASRERREARRGAVS